MKLVLIGGGGHCKSVFDSAVSSKKYESIVITDKNYKSNQNSPYMSVVGDDGCLSELLENGYKDAIISVGSIKSTALRREIEKKAKEHGFRFETIIDPSSVISVDSTISEGCFVGKKAVINSGVRIGCHAIINTGVIIEHDCMIGDFSHISVGAVVCGGGSIGHDVFIGANSTIIQGIKIGDNSIIGAGSIILKNVPDNSFICGVWNGKVRLDD